MNFEKTIRILIVIIAALIIAIAAVIIGRSCPGSEPTSPSAQPTSSPEPTVTVAPQPSLTPEETETASPQSTAEVGTDVGFWVASFVGASVAISVAASVSLPSELSLQEMKLTEITNSIATHNAIESNLLILMVSPLLFDLHIRKLLHCKEILNKSAVLKVIIKSKLHKPHLLSWCSCSYKCQEQS